MNQVAIVFGLIITVIVGAGAFNALSPLVSKAENQNMEAEIINVVNAAAEYAWVNRNTGAAADDFEDLVTDGYLDSERYDDGTGESIINTDITAAPLATTPTVTYDAADDESCAWLLQRAQAGLWPNITEENTNHTCASGTLTVRLQ